MRNAVLAFLAVPLFLTANGAYAETWQVYQEPSHQCHLEYPSSIFMRGTIDDHNFQTFANVVGDISIRIASRANDGNWTPAEIKAEFIKEKGDTLVYDRLKDDYLVLSGYQGDNIFYSKIALSEDRKNLCIMHLSYPTADKLELDAMVTRMSKSFRAQGHRISLVENAN